MILELYIYTYNLQPIYIHILYIKTLSLSLLLPLSVCLLILSHKGHSMILRNKIYINQQLLLLYMLPTILTSTSTKHNTNTSTNILLHLYTTLHYTSYYSIHHKTTIFFICMYSTVLYSIRSIKIIIILLLLLLLLPLLSYPLPVVLTISP